MCSYYRLSGGIFTEKLSLGLFLGFQKWYILEASTLHPHAGPKTTLLEILAMGLRIPYNANNHCLLV